MKIINALFSRLKSLIKLPFAKPNRRTTQQVDLDIQETDAAKYFCYFNNNNKNKNNARQVVVMNCEEISSTNVTQLYPQQSNAENSETKSSDADSTIINLFEHLPTKTHQSKGE